MIYKLLHKINIHFLVLISTFMTVAISGGVTALVLFAVFSEINSTGFFLSVIVPLVLAPPQLYFLLLNHRKLKKTEQELTQTNIKLKREVKTVTIKENELKMLNSEIEERITVRTAELEKSLKEKDMLLSELHHRVKNNLQLILSMIRLQIKSITNEADRKRYEEIQHRIFSMAHVYEQLYKMSNFDEINLKLFIPELTNNIIASTWCSDRITLSQEIDEIRLHIDKAIPLSLLITEILYNSVKHAFPENRTGKFELSIKQKDNSTLSLVLADNGIGISKTQGETLGFKIIESLINQLNGTMTREMKNGVKYLITLVL
ncbi:MAG: histidine kinase dimerization/phosphoacceptor domain -containing protein [Spirochaetia bacterium]